MAAYLFHSASGPTAPLGIVMALSCAIIPPWFQAVNGAQTVHIVDGKVEVSWRTVFFGQRHTEFPLGMFASVVSYTIANYRGPGWNMVDLVTASGTHSLNLVTYPTDKDGLTERDKARVLRLKVSHGSGLKDDGFVGVRAPKHRLALLPSEFHAPE